MISKLTRSVLRMLVRELREPYNRYEPEMVRAPAEEVRLMQAELMVLASEDPEVMPPASTAIAKFEAPDWEYMNLKTYPTNEAPAVRRLKVPGGFIYQVAFQDPTGKWHPPTFVPDPSQITGHDINELVNAARRV